MQWFDALDAEFARQVLQRGVAAVFVVAFLSTAAQFPALLGERGLLPVPMFVRTVSFSRSPSLFFWHYSDRMLRLLCATCAGIGVALVAGVPQLGPPWLPLVAFLVLWAVYLSIVNVGQSFYGFGWETLLLEAGFVVAFLGSDRVAPPLVVLFFLRWIVFRLEFGAGLIKLRGGSEWRDLTALDFHHETQPMPGPFSWHAHRLPRVWHRIEVLGSHTVQLIVPVFLFAPQPIASVAALLVMVTQLWLVVTGNFAWLNWLTIVLAASALGDQEVRAVVPAARQPIYAPTPLWWSVVTLSVAALLVLLSWRPLRNLFARRQLMNASFNRFHLVNAYGAFGTVTRERLEVVVEGTLSERPDADAEWREYPFRGKPGETRRRPGWFAPYHLRLDWLMWFLALGAPAPWFRVFLRRLLEGDPATLRLLRADPFPGTSPRWVRATLYAYRFTTRAERRATDEWWVRQPLGALVAPLSLPRVDPAAA